jgi:hypothetical protein
MGITLPVPGPTLVQTLAPAVAVVQIYISPEVVFAQTVPTPPAGLVDIVGSELDFVISLGKLVRLAPLIAGNVAGNLASAIVPVNLLAANAAFLASGIVPVVILEPSTAVTVLRESVTLVVLI